MTVHPSLKAREPRAAARTAVFVLSVCAVVIGLFAALGPAAVTAVAGPVPLLSVVGLAVVAATFAAVPAEPLDRAAAFLLLAVSGVVALSLLTVGSGISSTASQAFLAFAVLYAGFHLRPAATALVTAVALAGDAYMLAHQETFEAAVTDFVFFGAMLALMGGVLAHSTERQERAVAELSRLARVDALTGLVTRRVFDESLEAALAAPTSAGVALALMDVDDFKGINDGHGHPVGDDALVHLAAVVARQVRASDAVVSRFGGDELALLIADCAPRTALRRAQEILDEVRAAPLPLPDGTLLALSVSIGVAHAPRHATGLRHLYFAADAALYEAKRNGRGRVAEATATA